MKIANVAPPGLLEAVIPFDEDYHLILAEQVVTDERYRNFYLERSKAGQFIILDNGAYEYGTTPSLDLLVSAAKQTRPTEVVLPDQMFGKNAAEKTVQMATEGSRRLRQEGFESFMAVPHGEDISEWILCAAHLHKIPGVRSFGIAEKDALKLANGDRGTLVRAIQKMGLPLHGLGMMENMSDLLDPWTRLAMRGVDGSKLIVWGLNDVSVPVPVFGKVEAPYPGRDPNFWSTNSTDTDYVDTIMYNIATWREFMKFIETH